MGISLRVFTRLVFLLGFTAGCNLEHSANTLAPTSSGPSATPSAATPMVGEWATTQSVTVPSASSCTNFHWNVTSQTASSMTGDFTAVCAGNLSVSGTASGQINGTTIPITATGTISMPGAPSCSFSLTGTGHVDDNTTLTIPYTGTTCLGPVSGTEVLHRRSDPAPAPAPAPTPTPNPPPGGGGGSVGNPADQINLAAAVVYNSPPDIASWPVTARVTQIEISSSLGVNVHFTTQNSWPDTIPPGFSGPIQYTVWPVVNINGQWYTSGIIEMWRGRNWTGAPILTDFARNWVYDSRWGAMMGYQPQAGETMGFFVAAGDQRGNRVPTSVRERSNVVLVTLPAGDGVFNY